MRQFTRRPWLAGGLAAMISAGSATWAYGFQDQESIIIQPNVQRQAEQRTTLTGEFTSQHQGMITVTREGQNPQTFRTTGQTQVTINGRPARLEDLQKGDQLRVTEGAGGVVRIEAQRQPGERPGQAPQQPQQETERPAQQPQQPNQQIEERGAGFRGEAGEAERRQQLEETPNGQQQAGDAWLGVLLRDSEGNRGVEVVRIYPSGPAARAGLFPGDVLVRINDQAVNSPDEAANILGQAKPNEEVELTLQRGEVERTITAILGDRTAFLGQPPRRTEQQQGEGEFDQSMIPDHAMMLEHHRHMAAQHQRLERKLDQLLTEMEELRKALGQQRPDDVREAPQTLPDEVEPPSDRRNPLQDNRRNPRPERPRLDEE